MQLSTSVELDITRSIRAALESGRSFPLTMRTKGGIAHKISLVKKPSGYLITVIEVDGTSYLVYLI